MVVPPGFEPGSWDPEPHMMDHYTKGLMDDGVGFAISTNPTVERGHSGHAEGRIDAGELSLTGPQLILTKC